MGDNKDQRVENWKEQETIKGNEEYSVWKRRKIREAKELTDELKIRQYTWKQDCQLEYRCEIMKEKDIER